MTHPGDHEPSQNSDEAAAAVSILAAAEAVVAVAEATVAQEQLDAADAVATEAWALVPDGDEKVEPAVKTEAREASDAAGVLEVEHNRFANRAVVAATLAAEALAASMPAAEFANSDVVAEGIADIVAATMIAKNSDIAVAATAVADAARTAASSEAATTDLE